MAAKRARRDTASAPTPGRAKTSYREILIEEILEGLGELRRPTGGLLLSAFAAGLEIGFSVLLMAIPLTFADELPPLVVRLLVANFYAVGFLFVVMGRSELFTEHTTLAVFPVLAQRASVAALARLWALVFAGNVVGALAMARLLAWVGPGLGVATPEAFGEIARSLLEVSGGVILLSATLAGWLMGLLSWLLAASRDTVSQILFVWLVTFSIGLAQLHHSILGVVEVGVGVFAGQGPAPSDLLRFLGWTTLGNSIGGAVFVALIKYGHVVRSVDPEDKRSHERETRSWLSR